MHTEVKYASTYVPNRHIQCSSRMFKLCGNPFWDYTDQQAKRRLIVRWIDQLALPNNFTITPDILQIALSRMYWSYSTKSADTKNDILSPLSSNKYTKQLPFYFLNFFYLTNRPHSDTLFHTHMHSFLTFLNFLEKLCVSTWQISA